MSNSEFEYSFGVAVRLGPYGRTLARPGVTRAERYMFTPFAKFLDSGCAYVQLTSQKSGTTSYFYDSARSSKVRIFRLFTATAMAAGAAGYWQATQGSFISTFSPLLVTPVAVVASTIGPGRIVRKPMSAEQTITISYRVSKPHYDALRKELSELCKQPRKGTYSILFNNCADFAVAFAKDHGFDVPEPRVKTPYNLYTAIEKRYKNQIAPQ